MEKLRKVTLGQIENMLQFVSPECSREDWVQIGMAIHSELGGGGYHAFRKWSMGGSTFKDNSCWNTYKSFKSGPISIGTLAKKAKDAGYQFDGSGEIDYEEMMRIQKEREEEYKKAQEEKLRLQIIAAEVANEIMTFCKLDTHAYLAKKGFPTYKTNIINQADLISVIGEDNLKQEYFNNPEDKLVVPMWKYKKITGVQLIDIHGEKRFLKNQSNSMSRFTIGSGDKHIFCEGYATALSILQCIKGMGDYRIHVCFSVGNLKKVALMYKELGKKGFVIADHDREDKHGHRAGNDMAVEVGYPYYLSETEGNDLNDDYQLNKFKTKFKLIKILST